MQITPALNAESRALLWRSINCGQRLGLLPGLQYRRKNFLAQARRVMRRGLTDPGDCAGDNAMLAALAVAQAEIGMCQGWIPEVQSIAYLIVSAPGF